MSQQFECKSVLRSMFIVIESLRNSLDELVIHLRPWLARETCFEDDVNHDWRELWLLCGLSSEWVEIAEKSHLRFVDGFLKVSTAMREEPNLMQLLETFILNAWQWRRFNDARWATVGPSCRYVLASFLLGLDDLVSGVLATPGAHTY